MHACSRSRRPLTQPAAATHRSYVCNRTADGDSDWSVARIEEAAQAAYNGIEFGLNTPPSTDCKRYLHQWVCWQVRPALPAPGCGVAWLARHALFRA